MKDIVQNLAKTARHEVAPLCCLGYEKLSDGCILDDLP